MNIVILSDGYRKGDDRTRIGFLKKLNRFGSVYAYGPNEHKLDPEFAPIEFNPTRTYYDLMMELRPDFFIIPMYSIDNVNMKMLSVKGIGVPFAIIESDHYTTETEEGRKVLEWYKHAEFQLILRRHCYKPEHRLSNAVWIPPSGNDEEFYPNPLLENKNIIGFAGTFRGRDCYNIRYKALEMLLRNELLDSASGKIWGKLYIEFMQSHIGCMSCSGGILHTVLTKCFEIPMCGAVLMCNKIDHSDLLFDNKECYVEFKDDCSDVLEKARLIINDHDYVKEVLKNSQEQINAKHTDSKRIIEMHNVLQAFIDGKETPRIWGE